MTEIQLYAYTLPAHDGLLLTAPRPLPGRHVGFVEGTGFKVYDVLPAGIEEAGRLDGKAILPISQEAVVKAIAAYAENRGFDLVEIHDAYDGDLTTAFADLGLGRIITVEAV